MDQFWSYLPAAVAIAIPAVCTAWAQARIGPAISGMLTEKPELSAIAVLLVAIPETMVILGFVVAVMMILRMGG
jgi:V/A-type H+-transporting ATPase subunit K